MRLCLLMRLDPSQRRTHGQGVDQSTGPLQGVTQGGERERRRRSLSEIGKESLIIIVNVSHTLATQRHHQSALALGVWRVTLCLSFLPSIHLSPFHLTPTYTSTFFSLSRSQSPTLFVSAKGIFVMLSSTPLSITAIPASPVILVPARGSGMSSFCVLAQPPFYPWVKDTFL